MPTVARSIPRSGYPDLCFARLARAHEGAVTGQSIGCTISNAIVRSWLWSTATRSCTLGYFSSITGVVDI